MSVREFTPLYKRYVLSMLLAVNTLNFVDRGVVILLLQSIKEDLLLSDTQLGFLTGIAFAMFYATLGIPIARWADHGNRVMIASIAMAFWSFAVMCTVFVNNFLQLLTARMMAAVGEAGGMPPTYSLVGDYFPGPERTKAMAVYMLGNPLSALVAFALAGWLNALYGWRVTFLLVGIPGFLIAVLVRFTMVEPRLLKESRAKRKRSPPFRNVLAILWRQPSSRHLLVGFILFLTMALGLQPWYAAFLIRSHGMGTSELGVWLGLIFGVGGIVGIYLGGYIADRWFSGNERSQVRLGAIAIALLVPCFVVFLLAPQKHHALIALGPLMVVFNCFLGPVFTLMQKLVLDEMRATTLAVAMFLGNLIGMGIGSQIVGVLSDTLTPLMGKDALRTAMLIMSFVALGSAYFFWIVGRTVTADLQALRLRQRGNAASTRVGETIRAGVS